MPEPDHTDFLFMTVPFVALISCVLLIGALA